MDKQKVACFIKVAPGEGKKGKGKGKKGEGKKGEGKGEKGKERGKRVDKGVKRELNGFPQPPTFLHFIISSSHQIPFVPLLSSAASHIPQSFPNLTIYPHKADICLHKADI